jgi:hypothetical protein
MGDSLNISLASAPSGDGHDLEDLKSWIRSDDSLRGVSVELEHSELGDDEMGGEILQALQVALGPGGAVAGIAAAIATWATARRKDVSVSVTGKSGKKLTARIRGANDVDTSLREISALIRESDSQA